MRLELKKGVLQSTVINDSYSADLGSLRIALEFLGRQQPHEGRTVVLSDIPQHGQQPAALYRQVAKELRQHHISRFIGVGPELTAHSDLFTQLPGMETRFYPDTASFRAAFRPEDFRQQVILLKGARSFAFEQ